MIGPDIWYYVVTLFLMAVGAVFLLAMLCVLVIEVMEENK